MEYSRMLLLFLVAFQQQIINAAKVKDRMKGLPRHEFIAGYVCDENSAVPDVQVGGMGADIGFQFQKGLNYTFICSGLDRIGYPNESGSYDGQLGKVQRNEINTFPYFFPYDSIPYEPGIFVQPPISAFTPFIYSAKFTGSQKTGINVMYLYTNFTPTQWIYWIISLNICTIFIISVYHFKAKRRKFRSQKMLKRFIKSYWNYIMLTLDMAPTSVSRKLSCSILWAFIVLAIYYGIHMIFMSTFSADLSAKSPDYWIDSLDDLLFDQQYRHMKPTILKILNTYRVLEQSAEGSRENMLFRRSVESDSVVDLDLKKPPENLLKRAFDILAEVSNGNRSLVEDALVTDVGVGRVFCFIQPKVIRGIVKSKYPGYNVPNFMVLSHNTHPKVVELFEYRSANNVELGVGDGAIRQYSESVRSLLAVPESIEGFMCEQKFLNMVPKVIEQDWNPLPMAFFTLFIIICSSIIFIALIVLIAENVLYNLVRLLENGDNDQNGIAVLLSTATRLSTINEENEEGSNAVQNKISTEPLPMKSKDTVTSKIKIFQQRLKTK